MLFRSPDEREVADRGKQRKQHRSDQIDVHERIERDAPEHPRCAVTETVGGPRVGRFVNRERDQKHAEAEGDAQEIDVVQGTTGEMPMA